jgi:hypothetical protein
MTTSNKQRTIDALIASGGVEIAGASKLYRVFRVEWPDGRVYRYLVGRSGALRCCRDDEPIAASKSLTGGRLHRHLIAGGTIGNFMSAVAVERA